MVDFSSNRYVRIPEGTGAFVGPQGVSEFYYKKLCRDCETKTMT